MLPKDAKGTLDNIIDDAFDGWYWEQGLAQYIDRMLCAATYAFRHNSPQNMRLYTRLEWGLD